MAYHAQEVSTSSKLLKVIGGWKWYQVVHRKGDLKLSKSILKEQLVKSRQKSKKLILPY